MSNMTPRNSAQKNAQGYFSKGEPRSDALAKLQKKERAAVAANTKLLCNVNC